MANVKMENGSVILKTDKKDYVFAPETEFMEIQSGGYILRKTAISRIIEGEGIAIGKPEPLGSDVVVAGRICVVVSATDGNRTVYEVGSAGQDNLINPIAQSYPIEMAHNRAKQRAVLSLLGVGGLIYGEDEIDKSELKQPSAYTQTPPQTQYEPIQMPQQPTTQQPTAAYQPQNGFQTAQNVPSQNNVQHPWLSNQQWVNEAKGSGIDPDRFILNTGRTKNYQWSASQTLANDPDAVEWFASKPLGANNEFNGAVLACRMAIIKAVS